MLEAEAAELEGRTAESLNIYSNAQSELAQANETGLFAAHTLLQHAHVRASLGLYREALELESFACELLSRRAAALGLQEERSAHEIRNIYVSGRAAFAHALFQISCMHSVLGNDDQALQAAREAVVVLSHTRTGPAQSAATMLQLGRALSYKTLDDSTTIATLRHAATCAVHEVGCGRPEARQALLRAAAVHIRHGDAPAAALLCLRTARSLAELSDMLQFQPEMFQGLGAAPPWALDAINAADAAGHIAGLGLSVPATDSMQTLLALRLYVALCAPQPLGSLGSAAEVPLQAASLYAALVASKARSPLSCTLPDGAFDVGRSDHTSDPADIGSLAVQWLVEVHNMPDMTSQENHTNCPSKLAALPNPVTTQSILSLPSPAARASLLFVACVADKGMAASVPTKEVQPELRPAVKKSGKAALAAQPEEPVMQGVGRWHSGMITLPVKRLRKMAGDVRAMRVALERQESAEEDALHSRPRDDSTKVPYRCLTVAEHFQTGL
jgi:hypothetical protein